MSQSLAAHHVCLATKHEQSSYLSQLLIFLMKLYKMSNISDCDDKRSHFKKMILRKLSSYDWYQNQVHSCKTYLDNNGTKTTTLEEIRDFLLPSALKSFPKPVKDEMIDEIDQFCREIAMLESS